uniref:Uncharacterized protein n=1 Tax=Nelumbo nucifera TaxID=4432 RepID=A0A822ZKN3_NELNU|nr:TPA_asm: hypothetical protein HUJ06_002225 [Nelumbo nucifera]
MSTDNDADMKILTNISFVVHHVVVSKHLALTGSSLISISRAR